MGALENVKEIAVLVQKYHDQELYQRIVDLRDEIFNLREENLTLKQKLNEIKEVEDISSQLVRVKNHYYRVLKDGTQKGPFCLACWDGDRKLVNVLDLGDDCYECGRCKR